MLLNAPKSVPKNPPMNNLNKQTNIHPLKQNQVSMISYNSSTLDSIMVNKQNNPTIKVKNNIS